MVAPVASTTTASRLFYPFRALGAVTDGLPFVLNRRGDECFLTVSIDRAFQVQEAKDNSVHVDSILYRTQ